MAEKKVNYGWIIVAYGVLCMLILHYGTIGSQAIFLLPITEDMGVSTTTLTLASTYGTVVSLIVTPLAGKLMDRKSIRKLMFIGVLGTGLTMVAQSYMTSVYVYYLIILIRTALNPFALMMPFAALTARWFTKENRSFAASIVFVGISLGGVLLSNPLAALIESIGWRLTYRYYGLTAVAVLAPLTLLLIRDYPDHYEEMIRAEEPEAAGGKADFLSLFKDVRFLLICVGMGCISFIGCSLYHISSYVQSLGYDAQFGAFIISLYNFACIFSKMIMGRLFDRRGLRAGILFGALGIAGSYFLMAISIFKSSAPFLIVIALFYGIGNTCQSITAPSLVSGVFGVKNYSEIYAKLTTVTMVVSAVSTPLLSAIYEASGNYFAAWAVCFVLSVVSTASLLAVSRICQK